MAQRKHEDLDAPAPEHSANITSLKLLLPEKAPAPSVGRAVLATAPLCCWMLDALDPQRVLTVGGSSELLHLILCQSAEDQLAETVCAHLAANFTKSFLDARAQYGAVRSQLLIADPTAPLFGAEGQWSLIILGLDAAPDPDMVRSWRNGLCQDGVLAAYWRGGEDADVVADASWRVGEEQIALFWSASAPELVKTLAGLEAPASPRRTLGDVLATFVALLSTRQSRRARESAEAETVALRERHRQDLILLTRKLAELEEQNIAQRAELKVVKKQLEKAMADQGDGGPETDRCGSTE